MDQTFIEGSAAFISAILIFVGSIWLLLTMLMGARLAYFVTASVTLAFTLIMGVVWSINPLGPVGELPSWSSVGIGESVQQVEFGPASSYPEDPWRPVNEEDQQEQTEAAELETAADEELERAIEEGELDAFESASVAQVDTEQTRLLEQDGDLYGAVTFIPLEGEEGGPAVAVLQFDPGNPLGPARMITAGTFILFVGHLFFLSRAEAAVRKRRESNGTT